MRPRNSEHIRFGSNIGLSWMHSYSYVSISIRNLKFPAWTITDIWLRATFKNGSRDCDHAPFMGALSPYRIGFDTVYLHAKFDYSSFSRSRDIIGVSKFKVDHVTLTTPLLKMICHFLCLDLTIAYMCTKFDHSSFSRSRDTVGAHQNLNGSHHLITPLSWTVCHPWASTCYRQPTYQIWSFYLYPLRR